MAFIQQTFTVPFQYKVHFTEHLFSKENALLKGILEGNANQNFTRKILFILDGNLLTHFPDLCQQIDLYFKEVQHIQLVAEKIIVPGGETAKNDTQYLDQIVEAVNVHGIDRHSYLAAIGGGSVLDLAGYAAAISHRGIRHIRIATTVLSQNDSGVGVKNGINYKGKKNFLGTFAPPFAVINDSAFLTTLSDRDWRSGISEALKVALIKDSAFYSWIDEHAEALVKREMVPMNYLIRHCAKLHLEHIAGGDPFEFGSSRPLDFGHWSAHKLEQLSDFSILHGEAVSMGIALDTLYSAITGLLSREEAENILQLIARLQLPLFHPLMKVEGKDSPLLMGLTEFQEHLGGQLTIMLLTGIGKGKEVHEIKEQALKQAVEELAAFAASIHVS